MSTSFPTNATGTPAFTKNQPLLTIEDLKKRYLFGVDLRDDNGNEIDDSVLQHNLDMAVSFVEHELDIIITPRQFKERYDYKKSDYDNFLMLNLKKRPVISVEALEAVTNSEVVLIKYPEEWVSIEKESAQIQISPSEGAFGPMFLSGGSAQLPLLPGRRDYWPHLIRVEYTAGFCPDEIPVIINEIIGLQASLGIFDIFGDLVIGAGIANESTSIDAVSTSQGSTASAMYSGYSARIESYSKRIKKYLDTARRYYHAGSLVVV